MSRAATVLEPRSTTTAPGAAQPGAAQPGAAQPGDTSGAAPGEQRSTGFHTGWRRAGPLLAVFAVYLAIATAAWWHLLATGFGTALPAGSADPAQEAWFLAWLPHALGSGENPFFSHAIFFPQGVNLLDNTSMELLGLLLAPVTVTAGPVASLDLAVLLAPACSALGFFVLCRRYVRWSPAAFAGGLCYGFGPFLAGDLRYGHLDLTWLVLPPLIFCCLDALLLARTPRPLRAGAVLGILVVAQFFVSTEMLAITAVTAAVVAVVLAVARPREAWASLGAAWRGLACATAIVVVALAYPFWVVVAGPRHVVGPVWHHIGAIATSLAATVEPHGELAGVAFVSGSNGSYLGVALLAVLAAGAAVLWRSPVLRVALLSALLAYLASLGYALHVGHHGLRFPLPAAVFGHLALLDSIVPERFAAMVDLFCGLALAVILDRIRRSQPDGPPTSRLAATVPVALALAVGAFALVPFATASRWPYTVASVSRPGAFAAAAPGDPAVGRPSKPPVVAIYPDSSSSVAEQMVWQAEGGFAFTLPDGYAIVPGPGRHAVEAPRTDALWLVFAAASVHRLTLPLTHTTRVAVRADLRALGVDEVVVISEATDAALARGALREVLGRGPDDVAGGAAVWRVGRLGR